MTWASRSQPIQVGDRVQYSVTWLQSTGNYTGDLPFAKGTVTALKVLSPEVVLAVIDWGNPDIPEKVNVRNLEKASQRGR